MIKIKFGNIWNISQYENWFSDMARKGWFIKKVGTLFVHFTKGEPKQMRYRIAISQNPLELEQKGAYAEKGWEYITGYDTIGQRGHSASIGKLHVFLSPMEMHAPDLQMDSAQQSCVLNQIHKFFRKCVILSLIFTAIFSVLCGLTFSIGGIPYLNLLNNDFYFVLAPFIYLSSACYYAYGIYSVKAFSKSLSEGDLRIHTLPWKRRRLVTLLGYGFLTFFCVLIIVFPLMQIARIAPKTLPMESDGLPIVRLSDIEQNPDLERETDGKEDVWYDVCNNYQYRSSLLAPLQYETEERGILANVIFKDNSGTYSPSITTTMYQLTIPLMANKVIEDLMKRNLWRDDSENVVEIENNGFDKLFVYIYDSAGYEIFAAKGRGVIFVRYFGNADIDTAIAAIAEKIALIS